MDLADRDGAREFTHEGPPVQDGQKLVEIGVLFSLVQTIMLAGLLGITTFYLKGGQSLNFAVAGEDFAK